MSAWAVVGSMATVVVVALVVVVAEGVLLQAAAPRVSPAMTATAMTRGVRRRPRCLVPSAVVVLSSPSMVWASP